VDSFKPPQDRLHLAVIGGGLLGYGGIFLWMEVKYAEDKNKPWGGQTV
jgi:hypothetical protein